MTRNRRTVLFWLAANFGANVILVHGVLQKLNGGESAAILITGILLTAVCIVRLAMPGTVRGA